MPTNLRPSAICNFKKFNVQNENQDLDILRRLGNGNVCRLFCRGHFRGSLRGRLCKTKLKSLKNPAVDADNITYCFRQSFQNLLQPKSEKIK